MEQNCVCIPHIAGSQREPGNLVLRQFVHFPQKFWGIACLFARYQSEEIKILNISFFRVGGRTHNRPAYTRTLVSLRHYWSQ